MCNDSETQEELETINNFLADLPRTNRNIPMVLLSGDNYIPDDQILKEMQEDDSKRSINY